MVSLFDDLESKLRRDPSRIRRGGPRYDLGLLLFNARDSIRLLWIAADEEIRRAEHDGRSMQGGMRRAVEALRPIFGLETG